MRLLMAWRLGLGLLAAVLIGAGAAGCATLDQWQRQVIFQPNPGEGRWVRDTPADADVFDLSLPNGDRVHTWYLPAADPQAPTVLYLHGARWNLNGSVFRMQRWRDMGFALLAIDYRGFGRSTPQLPSEDSAHEDTRRAFEELVRRQPDPTRRFVYGHSLGGAMAVHLAAHNDDADPDDAIAGLIIESSFTSIQDMVRLTRWGWVPMVRWAVTQRLDSATKLAQVREPVLFIHGTRDQVVPHMMSDRLYEAAVAAPHDLRRLVKIEGASHSAASRVGGEDYAQAVWDFVRDAAAHTVRLHEPTREAQAAVAGHSAIQPADRSFPSLVEGNQRVTAQP